MKALDLIDRVVWIVAMLVGIAAGAAICIVVSNGAGADGQNWAAWLQALGSILALGVAIYLSEVERSHRRSEREEERHEVESGFAFDLLSITTELHGHVVELQMSSDGQRGRGYYAVVLAQIKELGARLSKCSTGAIPAKYKTLAIDVRKLMRVVMEHAARKAFRHERNENPDWATLVETASRLFDQAALMVPDRPKSGR